MSESFLKDGRGVVVAVMKNGPVEDSIYDVGSRQLGRYVKSTNMTYDNNGNVVGHGNILTSLIKR